MKYAILGGTILSAFVFSAAQARVTTKPRTEIKVETKLPTTQNPAAKNRSNAVGNAFGSGAALDLNQNVGANACLGTSIIQDVSATLSGAEKTKFVAAAGRINGGPQGIVIQPCQNGEGVTDKDALKNLGLIVIAVDQLIQTNQGAANDINTWAKGFQAVFPSLGADQALERARGVASDKCRIIKAQL